MTNAETNNTARDLKFYAIERQYVRALAEARREGRKEDERLILARLNEMKIN